ncbi:probable WRKY transcription factor 40 isoform X1 [Lycium ferocissimum]|uniref:probable WRKY transcription factor 40 isoform X1 n=1 Tax=Lycium ferocissimum TaxID=112874 RepID=UPI0028159B24|nr:probable WRKY transcription factor 40 isoform X1 [Lycium ferocissimum]
MDPSLGNKSFTIDLNTNPSLHNINRSPVTHEILDEELIGMRNENKKLTTMLTTLCENYNTLQAHLLELLQNNSTHEEDNSKLLSSRKRMAEDVCCVNNSDINIEEASPKRPREITTNISTVCVKAATSDQTSVVKDGYHWRKYGQKVTRDNPFPRAYYKCSFAPTCPVKKKVQRSVKDPSVLVATYEGEHNHLRPSQAEETVSLINQDVTTDPKFLKKFMEDIDTNSLQQQLVKQMTSSLTKNPTFTAAVAAAISGDFLGNLI